MSRKRRTVADEPHLLVRTSASDHPGGASIAAHTHDWHQLIHVQSGLMSVRTSLGSWIAPPAWAIWVPAGVSHALRFAGASTLRTLYVRPSWSPGGCRSLAVSPLLRELIARTAGLGMLDGRDPVEAALATLIAGELAAGVARRPASPCPSRPARPPRRRPHCCPHRIWARPRSPGRWAWACGRWSGASSTRPA